ncbi:MAG: nuclear transport factor 2 family protein [Gemmatimonadaceae bacterium]|nr:nuclear transport factor 2 family protein [Gemmatimonadaceae bacterium]
MTASSDDLARLLVGAPDAEIVALESELRRAQLNADVARLDALLADDLLFTGPDGQLGTKAQDLAAHASGQVRFRRHDVEELRIRRVGVDVAICALSTALEVEVAGDTVRGRFRYTRVWGREMYGNWRVVGGHVAAVS